MDPPGSSDARVSPIPCNTAAIYPTCSFRDLGANVPGKSSAFMLCFGFPSYVPKYGQDMAKGSEAFLLF
jgi:hypothetical protein